MISVSDTITVDRPREAVYEYLDDPHNHGEITPSLTDVRDVERLDNGGKRLAFTYSIGGIALDGELEEAEHVPPETLRFEMRGRLSDTGVGKGRRRRGSGILVFSDRLGPRSRRILPLLERFCSGRATHTP